MQLKTCLLTLSMVGFGSLWTQSAAHAQVRTDSVQYLSRAMAIRFSRDSKRLINAGAITSKEVTDKRLRVWDVQSGHEVHRLPAQPIFSDYDFVGRTLLMPDFDLMLTTWGAWEVKPIHIHSFRFEPFIEVSNGNISSLALSPDEKILAIGVTRAVEFRDARTFKLLRTYEHGAQNTQVQFGPDSTTVICTWGSSKPQVIDANAAKQICYPRWFYRVSGADAFAFSPDGKRLAKTNGQTIEIWTTPTQDDAGLKLGILTTVLPVVLTLQFSPDGQTLAVGGLSKSLKPVEFLALTK